MLRGNAFKIPPLWWECISDSQRALPPPQPNQDRIAMWRNVVLNQKRHSETHKTTALWSGCPSHSKERVERFHCTKDVRQELAVSNGLNDSTVQNPPMSVVFHHLSQHTRVVCSVNVPCGEDILTARVIFTSTYTLQPGWFGTLVVSNLLLKKTMLNIFLPHCYMPLPLNNVSCCEAQYLFIITGSLVNNLGRVKASTSSFVAAN